MNGSTGPVRMSHSPFFFTRAWVEGTIGSLRLHSLFMRQWSNVGVLFLDGGYCSVVYCTCVFESDLLLFCVLLSKKLQYTYAGDRTTSWYLPILLCSLNLLARLIGSATRQDEETVGASKFPSCSIDCLTPPFLFLCICIAASMADRRPVWRWGEKSKQSATSMNHCLPTAGIIICTHTKR